MWTKDFTKYFRSLRELRDEFLEIDDMSSGYFWSSHSPRSLISIEAQQYGREVKDLLRSDSWDLSEIIPILCGESKFKTGIAQRAARIGFQDTTTKIIESNPGLYQSPLAEEAKIVLDSDNFLEIYLSECAIPRKINNSNKKRADTIDQLSRNWFLNQQRELLQLIQRSVTAGTIPIIGEWQGFDTAVRPEPFLRAIQAKGCPIPTELIPILENAPKTQSAQPATQALTKEDALSKIYALKTAIETDQSHATIFASEKHSQIKETIYNLLLIGEVALTTQKKNRVEKIKGKNLHYSPEQLTSRTTIFLELMQEKHSLDYSKLIDYSPRR